MKTSEAGRALIARREGRRLDAYRDSTGVWTIGVGHTGRMAPPAVTPGMSIDEAQCDAFLAADLAPIDAAIRDGVGVPVTQNEHDALASLAFNIGLGGLKRSTVLRRLNAGDVGGAADAFLMWDKPAVLASRRAEERAQFLTPDPGGAAIGAARAAGLARRADAVRRGAWAMQSGAAALTVGGTTAVAIAHHDRHGAAVAIGAAILGVGCVAAVVAIVRRRQAQALAAVAASASATAPVPSATQHQE